jgi:hypothetical protein
MMRQTVRFRGVKATPKSLEKDLLDKARRLADDPSLLLPKCEAQCRKCNFDKTLKKMEKVAKYRTDAAYLQDVANHGDQLVRAYAATISLAASGKIPYLTTKKGPYGDVSYAVRGKVDAERLIGVQYFDDPDLRLLAFWEDARDENLHLYSEDQRLMCTSDGPKAPMSYVDEMLGTAPYELAADHSCGHPDAAMALQINWRSSGIIISICSDCAADVNVLHHLVSRIAARDPTDDFDLDVRYAPKCVADCGDCKLKKRFSMSSGLKDAYKKGTIDDITMINRYLDERKAELRSSAGELFILSGNCFGKDKEAFIKALKGSEAELMAIAGLVRSKPVVVISASDQAGKIISDLWQENKMAMLSFVASEPVYEKVLEMSGNFTAPQMVQEARRAELAKGVLAKLPEFSSRGPIATLADDLARAFKIEGKQAMVRQLEKNRPKEHRGKAVAFGFLKAVGEADSRIWQFTREEMDYGLYLADFAKIVLESEGEAYHDALNNLLTASGASEQLVRKAK